MFACRNQNETVILSGNKDFASNISSKEMHVVMQGIHHELADSWVKPETEVVIMDASCLLLHNEPFLLERLGKKIVKVQPSVKVFVVVTDEDYETKAVSAPFNFDCEVISLSDAVGGKFIDM